MKKFIFGTTLSLIGAGALAAHNPTQAMQPERTTIVDAVLADDGEFDVLQAAVTRAGLVEALDGKKQLTVFAPTDQAFVETLGVTDEAAALDAVEDLNIDLLTNILLYHVIHGNRLSESVVNAQQFNTLGGEKLSLQEIVDAGINTTDLEVDNGVIHIIDSVLMPSN